MTFIFRNVNDLVDYVTYCIDKYGKRPKVTARVHNGEFEFKATKTL